MIELYVAKNGSNENDGSFESPLADIYAAKKKASMRLRQGSDVTVYIREGEYYLHDSVSFTEFECVKGRHLTVKAYGNERVSFLGGMKVGRERFTPATDAEKDCLIDREAAKNLMKIDLSDMKDSLFEIRNNRDFTYIPTALFTDGRTMWQARYPKRDINGGTYTYGPYVHSCGYEYTGEAKNKSVNTFFGEDVMDRTRLWSDKSRRDLWFHGFPKHEWSDETHRIVSIDYERGCMLSDDFPYHYTPIAEKNDKKRYFFFNIFEELASPYEYYIDYDNGYVYTCVENGSIPNDMYLGTLNAPMLDFNSSGNITFENISFEYTHAVCVKIMASSGITFNGCTFAHGAAGGLRLIQASGINILNCNIYDFQHGGIRITDCGDRRALKSANIVIDNCILHDVDQLYQCYNGCISLGEWGDVCGVSITHNTIYNSTHNLISMAEINDIEIAYNEIFNGCTDTDDSSVIYWGRNPSTLGVKIHDNYFHDCVCEWSTFGTAVIYQDDTGTGAEIYNNIFYKCGSHNSKNAALIQGHVFHHTFNNIFIEIDDDIDAATSFGAHIWLPACSGAYSLDADTSTEPGPKATVAHWFDILSRCGFFSTEWRQAYKGTFWQKLYDRLPLSLIAEVDEYREAVKGDPVRLQNAKLKHFAVNLAWIGKFYDGTPCKEDNIYECIRNNFPKEWQAAMAEVEGKGEAERLLRECQLVDEMYWFHKLLPDITVYHDTNLTVGIAEKYHMGKNHNSSSVIHANNFNMSSDRMPNGKSVFVDYGKDFTLTPEGIAYVQENIVGFHPIDTSTIGAKR